MSLVDVLAQPLLDAGLDPAMAVPLAVKMARALRVKYAVLPYVMPGSVAEALQTKGFSQSGSANTYAIVLAGTLA